MKTRTSGSRSRAPRSIAPPPTWERWRLREAEPVERALREILAPRRSAPASLRAAMRYAVFPGGKRLRPLLVVAGHRIAGGESRAVYRLAASLELVHAFTLIHDDLPCMDDDDFRRGRPTCHRVYGEGLAVLAGDALLNLAYAVQVELEGPAEAREAVLRTFARAVGEEGVLGGQVEDLDAEGRTISPGRLRRIHRRKTAGLIAASLRMGAEFAGAAPARADRLEAFGIELGMLFQLADDLLNVVGSDEQLGRPAGGDARKEKATYPRLLGVDRAIGRLRAGRRSCERLAEPFGAWSPLLADLTGRIAGRVSARPGKAGPEEEKKGEP